jgi:hypothetical protein
VRNKGICLATLALVLLAGLTPLAAAPVIGRGVDTFTTVPNGSTFYNFAQNPIPAGFFCKASPAFTGRVVLTGLPLATETPGQLHGADTVIERLDDAVFNDEGVANTRIRFKALSLVSAAPIRTGCGAYNVYITLAGEQRITPMRIDRTSAKGGTFSGPLAVDARMTFVPVRPARDKAAAKLELTGRFTFPATPIAWSHQPPAGSPKRLGVARIDTDGNLTPDALVSHTANFAPGWSPDALPIQLKGCRTCEPQTCHTDPATQKQHCSGPVVVCSPAACP